MKKVILIIALLLNSFFTFSQILDCPDYPNPNFAPPPTNIYSRSTLAPPPTSNKYVINVKFHIVKNTNGTGVTANYGEAEVMNAIMILNTHYNQYNIFFKYIGFDVIKNTSYMKLRSYAGGAANQNTTHPFFSDIVQYSKTGMSSPLYDYNAMNLFIVEGIDISTTTSFAQTAGVANRPGIDSVFAYNRLLTSTLPHEIGHNFNLLHTHQGTGVAGCELVNGSNSATAGDLVTDTPASYIPSSLFVSSTCGYLNPTNATDCMGTVYVNCPVKNFMSTNTGGTCREIGAGFLPGNAEFTLGQANRMREQIENYYNNSSNPYGYYNAKNTIESLYQPFAETGFSGTGNNTSTSAYSKTVRVNETRTGVNLVYTPTGITLRFQKGFDWEFSYHNVAPFTKTVTDQYNFNRGDLILNVKIPLLGTDVYQVGGYQSFSVYEPFTSGTVNSTSSLGNSTIQTTPLNSTTASDPQLIDNLDTGKYHIINKQTDSGIQDQNVIYKN